MPLLCIGNLCAGAARGKACMFEPGRWKVGGGGGGFQGQGNSCLV